MVEIPMNEIREAANGQEGLQVLQDEWIDLVLTDINMPVMNGIDMVTQMANDGMLQTVPVVVISTEGSQQRIDALKQQGISGYIRKPFTPEALKETLLNVLGETS